MPLALFQWVTRLIVVLAIAFAFLASPVLVVAFAIAGRIDIDLTVEPIGFDADNEPVYLGDIWPTNQEIEHLVVMKDIGTSDIIVTFPSDDLNSVLQKFTTKNIDSLPVVKDDDHGLLIGMLNRREVIAFYNEQVQKMKSRYNT